MHNASTKGRFSAKFGKRKQVNSDDYVLTN